MWPKTFGVFSIPNYFFDFFLHERYNKTTLCPIIQSLELHILELHPKQLTLLEMLFKVPTDRILHALSFLNPLTLYLHT